jgi:hypothetical protein
VYAVDYSYSTMHNRNHIWVATLHRRIDQENKDLIVSAHGRHVTIWGRKGMRQSLRFTADKTLLYYTANHSVQVNHNLNRFWQAIVETNDGKMPVVDTKGGGHKTANYKLWWFESDHDTEIRSIVHSEERGADVVTIGNLGTAALYEGGTSLAQVLSLIEQQCAVSFSNYTNVHCFFCRVGTMLSTKKGQGGDTSTLSNAFSYHRPGRWGQSTKRKSTKIISSF